MTGRWTWRFNEGDFILPWMRQRGRRQATAITCTPLGKTVLSWEMQGDMSGSSKLSKNLQMKIESFLTFLL